MILNDKCIFASWASILDLLLFIYFPKQMFVSVL